MCMKLLISAREASSILGPGGSTSREISQRTGAKLHLSGRGDFYPGTSLQELTVKGPSADAVAECLVEVFTRIVDEAGRISCGEDDVEEGSASLRFVVPVASAKAIIGRGGENIRNLRAISGLFVHIEEYAVGVADAAEQVVTLQGALEGVNVALPVMIDKVAALAEEPAFAAWAGTSHAGGAAPAMQMAPGKAGGRGGSWGRGRGGRAAPDEEVLGPPGREGRRWRAAPPAEPEWGPPAESAGSDAVGLLAGAVAALPPGMLSPADRSQRVTFSCPASCVSAVIGKGGAGVKEICSATQTKIMIRDVEGNAEEKAVILTGGAVGVAAAYLYLSGRVAAALASPPAARAPAGTPALPA